MRFVLQVTTVMATFSACTLLAACDPPAEADAIAGSGPSPVVNPVLADAPLVRYQSELLDLAFETATVIPIEPHIKDRSRAQEGVVAACIELAQPVRAVGYTEQIDNWRRGSAYGDLALFCARLGYTEEAQEYLTRAVQVSAEVEDWRRDRIRVKVAKVHALLGHNEQSDRFEADVVESESGKVAAVEAMVAADDAFNDQMVAIDQLLALGSFDITRNALESSTELFNRFYQDPVRRSLVEEKIKASSGNLPLFIRIELLMTLAEFALAHSDQAGALELVNEAQQLFESAQWQLEHWMPRAAGLAELRFQAGDPEKARDDAKSALARYEADGEQIVNIYRAKALRPLAAAYQSMGDTAGALAIYKQAVEAGVVNPNSRPRAEDLSATCCSMAVEGVEPDAELRARVHQIREGLGRPW